MVARSERELEHLGMKVYRGTRQAFQFEARRRGLDVCKLFRAKWPEWLRSLQDEDLDGLDGQTGAKQ